VTSFSFKEALTLNVTHEQLCPRDRLKKHITLNTHHETQGLPHRTAESTQLSLRAAVICHILFLEKRGHLQRSDITHPPQSTRQADNQLLMHTDAARSRFEPRKRLPCDVTVLFKTHIISFTVFVGKSTFVLLTLLFPAFGSPLSKHFCRCAGIVLQNGCQVAKRVNDFCGECVIHVITSEISRQRAGHNCARPSINAGLTNFGPTGRMQPSRKLFTALGHVNSFSNTPRL
jgi:hypothetical protein